MATQTNHRNSLRAARRLTVAILLVISTLVPCKSDGQNAERSGQNPSPRDIAQFFQGKLSPDNGRVLAVAYARFLHLMGEKPMIETVGPQASQVYRVLVETRPYNTPVIARLSIRPDGTGEVVVKVSQSARAADVLAVQRTVNLSHSDVGNFLKLLADSGFWSMPVLEPINTHRVVMGEAGWMFEGEKEGSYHVVCRGTSSLASLKKAVMFLVDVSKLDLASTAGAPSS
jgi:hypothetical protein